MPTPAPPSNPTLGQTWEFQGKTLQWNGSRWKSIAGVGPGIVMQVFTASGTYTPSAGMRYCICEVVGGGGAGGGVDGHASYSFGGGGGGSGAYSRSALTAADIGASQAITVGAGGTGVSASTGNAGSASSIGSLVTANGGSGGTPAGVSSQDPSGGAGGTAGTGDAASAGAYGANGFFQGVTTVAGHGGKGASSVLGGGGDGAFTASTGAETGVAAPSYGGGGGGGATLATASDATGGAGADGLIIITEYTGDSISTADLMNSISTLSGVITASDLAVTYDNSAGKNVSVAPTLLGGAHLLAQGTVTTAATLDIVLTSYTSYAGFMFVLDLLPVTDNVNLICRFSTDGGSSYDATGYAHSRLQESEGTPGDAGSGADTEIVFCAAIGNAAAEGAHLTAFLVTPTSTARWSRIFGHGAATTNAGACRFFSGAGQREAAQDTDAVRFLFASGNIASGNYRVYGLL